MLARTSYTGTNVFPDKMTIADCPLLILAETTPNYIGTTSTLDDKLDNYELSTGFIYDDANLTIRVFDE
jgi:hypothetical protein